MFLIDSHCHLDCLADNYDDVTAFIDRARTQNIQHLLTICMEPEKWDFTQDVCHKNPFIHAAIGVHPHDARHYNYEDRRGTFFEIAKTCLAPYAAEQSIENPLARDSSCIIALGETGLDYFRNNSPQNLQRESFSHHLEFARQIDLPVIIHAREAEEDCVALLRDYVTGQGAYPLHGVIHCFTGSKVFARKCLDLGFYISFSGIITFKKSEDLRDIARYVPQDRLLIETDSPYLAPEPLRGKKNEPAYMLHTAKFLGQLCGSSWEDFTRTLQDNFFQLFHRARHYDERVTVKPPKQRI